jgi:hypothetical protein
MATKHHVQKLATGSFAATSPGDASVGNTIEVWGEFGKNWQAIAAGLSDYSKRSLEDSSQTFQKLLAVRSLDQAVAIQTDYAQRSYDAYMKQLNLVGSMYADLAKDAGKPLEKLMQRT